MNAFASASSSKHSIAISTADVVARVVLAAISVAVVVFAHELVHLLVGRLAGIPAAFTGLTSVGIPRADVHLYAGWRLALMNGSAPMFTVFVGFAVLGLMPRLGHLPELLRYFMSWWAIFGIPYLGLQAMIVVASVDFSGNGNDSAAVAGYFLTGPWVLAIMSVAGFLYFMWSSRWVMRIIQSADGERAQGDAADCAMAVWRRVAAWLLVVIAIAGSVGFSTLAFGLNPPGLSVLAAFGGWPLACALLTRWRSPAARCVWRGWLIPGAIGMLALVPLGFVGGGNDFAQLWVFEMSPVFAATMLATRAALPVIGSMRTTDP